jgi:hypothetical protein
VLAPFGLSVSAFVDAVGEGLCVHGPEGVMGIKPRWTKRQLTLAGLLLGLVGAVLYGISHPIKTWAWVNRDEGDLIVRELEAYHAIHGEYPESLDSLELGFSARSLWGSWGYGEKSPGEYVLYLPYIKWLGDYCALVYRSDSHVDSKGSQVGAWQLVPAFAMEVTRLERSYFSRVLGLGGLGGLLCIPLEWHV